MFRQDPALVAPGPRAGTREWVGLSVLALPAFVIALDFSVPNLAVPEISRQLMPSATGLLWIVDIYGFMLAGFLVTMGTLGDRIGRRRLLMIGAAGFGLASVAAAYSVSASVLVGARAALGLAGATLMPSTLSLIRVTSRRSLSRPRNSAIAEARPTRSVSLAGTLSAHRCPARRLPAPAAAC